MDDPTGVIGFCHRVRPRLVGTLSLLCGDGDAAEELAQETLARVWLCWSRVRELDEPAATAWTYRVSTSSTSRLGGTRAPMLALGLRVHQRWTRSGSLVAAYRPWHSSCSQSWARWGRYRGERGSQWGQFPKGSLPRSGNTW
jgi:hypothetical protein